MAKKNVTEYQLDLMRVCNDCEERRNFNMRINDTVTNHNWCGDVCRYINLNTVYSNCKYNKVHLNKREPLKDILKRKMDLILK